MPELPEVETVRRGLAPIMENARVEILELRRPDLRFPFPDGLAADVSGEKIVSLGRRAKFLTMDLSNGKVLICHLGMSGSFRIEYADSNKSEADAPGAFLFEKSKNQKHDHVVFHLKGGVEGDTRVIYNDPRRFGYMQYVERRLFDEHPSFAHLGPEPVGNEFHANEVARRIQGKKAPLKTVLLDQRVIAGLGNIYVCEALWRSNLSPLRAAGDLVTKSGNASAKLEKLVDAIRGVIAEAIKAGGSSLRDHVQTDGSLGYFQHRFAAYDREGEACRKQSCSGKIVRIVQGGRSTFWCPKCQK